MSCYLMGISVIWQWNVIVYLKSLYLFSVNTIEDLENLFDEAIGWKQLDPCVFFDYICMAHHFLA